MTLRQTPDEYLFNLEALTPADAKRLWKERIKDNWNHTCAYCGSTEDITLDHVKPRSLGGPDTSRNIVCACNQCNHEKGHTEWKEWYQEQYFHTWERMKAIEAWIAPEPTLEDHGVQVTADGRYRAYRRQNRCYAKT